MSPMVFILSTFFTLISTARTLAAEKADSTSRGSGYMSLSPTWMEPTRYIVVVGETGFHMRKRGVQQKGTRTIYDIFLKKKSFSQQGARREHGVDRDTGRLATANRILTQVHAGRRRIGLSNWVRQIDFMLESAAIPPWRSYVMTTLGLLLLLLIAIVYIDGWITIFNKAGYNSLWGLAMLVPVLNVIAFLLLA